MSAIEKSINVHTEVILVTPSVAKTWLKKNTGNYRKFQRAHLEKMILDMKEGRWGFTNASIAFDENDKLVDGQHRLKAVVESGCPQPFLVVWNMASDAADDPRFDTGSRRSVATHLGNAGIKNSTSVAACTRALYSLAVGNTELVKASTVSDMQVCSIVEANEDIADAVHLGARGTGSKVLSAGISGAWYWLAKHDNEEKAKECIDIFVGVSESFTSHPFARAREYFLGVRSKSSARGTRLSGINRGDALKILFSAWDKAKKGQDVRFLRMPQSLDLPDACHKALEKLGVEPQNGRPV